ncbi:DMT family transporter [Carnobacteriaceae bacterium zg-ZUI240]|nr:DMT family transporter [Carnobacteriaceae bacterium zg-ZUI240]
MFLFLGIIAGFLIPFQTSFNTHLGKQKQSTLLAVITSFTIGLLLTTSLTLVRGESIFPNIPDITSVMIAAILGVIFVSGSVIVFAKLGATQTAILPVIGQITAGLIIDHFGLLNAVQSPVTATKLLGTFFVLLGVIGVVLSNRQKNASNATQHQNTLLLQILGVCLGAFTTIQTALNSHIGVTLHSPFLSTHLNFLFGLMILLLLATLKKEPFTNLYTKSSPWWSYLGGLIGFIFVLSTIMITPVITTSVTVLTTLLGLTMGSITIDTFGLFNTPKKALTLQKVVSLAILIGGVTMTHFL